MRVFDFQLVDDLAAPRFVLSLVLQKNIEALHWVPDNNSSPVSVAGSTSGWVKDNLPFNAQVVIVLPDGATVNVSESGSAY